MQRETQKEPGTLATMRSLRSGTSTRSGSTPTLSTKTRAIAAGTDRRPVKRGRRCQEQNISITGEGTAHNHGLHSGASGVL